MVKGLTDSSVSALSFPLLSSSRRALGVFVGVVALRIGFVVVWLRVLAGCEKGIPVGTPFLEGFPPAEEFPQVTWITQLVGSLLSIAVGTLR